MYFADCDDDDNSRDEPHSGLTPNHRSAAAQRSLIEQGFAGATEEDVRAASISYLPSVGQEAAAAR